MICMTTRRHLCVLLHWDDEIVVCRLAALVVSDLGAVLACEANVPRCLDVVV